MTATVDTLRTLAPPKNALQIHDDDVQWALNAVRKSGLVNSVNSWREEDRDAENRQPGGAPRQFTEEALLTALTLAALHDRPMLATELTDILFFKISPKSRERLGVPEHAEGERAADARYRNVRTRFHRFTEVVDPCGLPRNRRLSTDEFDALTVEIDNAVAEVREERLLQFANRIIEIGLTPLNRELKRKWKGDLVVDATPVRVFARGPSRNGRDEIICHSTEPEAGFYTRTGDADERVHSAGKRKTIKRSGAPKPKYAYEASLVLMVAEDPTSLKEFPTLVAGMAPLHKPAERAAQRAVDVFRILDARNEPKGLVCGDRLYSNSVPENFQLPVAALGYGTLFDYKITQLGRQGSHAGAPMIEGSFYCPAIPDAMASAELDVREGRIPVEISSDRHTARDTYRLRRKEALSHGHERLSCPAAGPNPTAKCPLKPKSLQSKAKLSIHPSAALMAQPQEICNKQSVVFGPEAGAKLRQSLVYKSQEWKDRYGIARNSIEGMNSHAKDEAFGGLELPRRRRLRGRAAQTILAAFQILGSNIRLIQGFIKELAREAEGKPRPVRPRRRKTKSLSAFDPRQTTNGGPAPP